MKRRDFLKAMVGLAVIFNYGGQSFGSSQKGFQPNCRWKRDFSLTWFQGRFDHYFHDGFLPFFLENMVNYKHGGFHPYTEWDGRPTSGLERQESWWLGRGIWMVSFLHNNFLKEQVFLDIAERAAGILVKNRPEGDLLWPKSFTPDGNPSEKPRKSIYDDLFIAEGLAEFGKASGDRRYLDLAKQTVLKCLKKYDSPRYEYSPTYGLETKPLKSPRILGHWMVFLMIATQILRNHDDPEIETVASRAVNAIMGPHFNPDFELLNEIINHDMSRPEGEFSQFVYTGHAMETLWMVMWEAIRRDDKILFSAAAKRFRRHVEVAWDDVYGGFFRSLNHVDRNTWELDKQMWVQVEVMVGMLMALEYGGFEWAERWYCKVYDYFIENFSLEKHGSPMWLLGGSRKPWDDPRPGTGAIYHLPRWMMMNMLSLNRMAR